MHLSRARRTCPAFGLSELTLGASAFGTLGASAFRTLGASAFGHGPSDAVSTLQTTFTI